MTFNNEKNLRAPGFQAAMKEELKKYKSPLNTHREKLQQLVDAEVAPCKILTYTLQDSREL